MAEGVTGPITTAAILAEGNIDTTGTYQINGTSIFATANTWTGVQAFANGGIKQLLPSGAYYVYLTIAATAPPGDQTVTIPGVSTTLAGLNQIQTWTEKQTFSSGIATEGTQARINSQTTTYTATTNDDVILCDASSAAFTVTLPAASTSGIKLLIVKTDSSANAVTVSRAGSDTIEGSTTKSISSQYGKLGLVSDGTSTWYDLSTGGGI